LNRQEHQAIEKNVNEPWRHLKKLGALCTLGG
jgi:hypothetical protein